MKRSVPTVLMLAVVFLGGSAVPPASAVPAPTAASTVRIVTFSNCAALNRVYPHGVGRPKAKDKTSSTPVKNYFAHAKLYAAQPKSLDRDKDGIACEKR